MKLTAMRRDHTDHAGIAMQFGNRNWLARERAALMRRLDQAQAGDGMRQLVEILNQLLNPRVNQPAHGTFFVAFAEHQSWNIIQETGTAKAMEDFARMLALTSKFHDPVEELEGDKFFAGADDIGVTETVRPSAEEIPGLVNGLGPAGQDQRALIPQTISIGNHLIGAGTMNLHAGDEEH